jgi:CheY-like chemotaxis protein
MQPESENRRRPSRRRQPRGGRRAEDLAGSAPLILLVGDGPSVVEGAEAILARLKFAVSTSANVDDAVRVLPQLRPDLVVTSEQDGARLRDAANVPVVVRRSGAQVDPDVLIEDIVRTLRTSTR